MRRILGALLLLGTIASTGCASTLGTVLTNASEPYVGTGLDVGMLAHGPTSPGDTVLFVADLPFSFAADTVMLPVTATRKLAGKRY